MYLRLFLFHIGCCSLFGGHCAMDSGLTRASAPARGRGGGGRGIANVPPCVVLISRWELARALRRSRDARDWMH